MVGFKATTKKQYQKRKNLLPRCNALNVNGQRCRKHSGIEAEYFGNSETYSHFPERGKPVKWVRINLCIDHAMGIDYDWLKR